MHGVHATKNATGQIPSPSLPTRPTVTGVQPSTPWHMMTTGDCCPVPVGPQPTDERIADDGGQPLEDAQGVPTLGGPQAEEERLESRAGVVITVERKTPRTREVISMLRAWMLRPYRRRRVRREPQVSPPFPCFDAIFPISGSV